MDLKPVQVCRTLDGWSPIQIASSSTPGLHYTVLVNPYVTVREFVCDCRGFEFRGKCRHQPTAMEHVCWWPLLPREDQPEQTERQKRDKTCPQCGGPTKWEMVEDGQ